MHFFRFFKFINVKKFFFDNEDIYNKENKDYFPNNVFNIDSFLLAVSINIFVLNSLYFCFPNKASFYDTPDCFKIDFYKDHILYKEQNFNNIQNIYFYPIQSLLKTYDGFI